MKCERGFGWERRDGDEIAYRGSRWSPNYIVADDQLRRLRTLKGWELLVAIVTVVPLALTYFTWLYGEGVGWRLLLSGVVAYAFLNHLFWMYCQNRRAQILKNARLASVPLEFPPLFKRRKNG